MQAKFDVASVSKRETQDTIASWIGLVEAEPSSSSLYLTQDEQCAHPPEMFGDLVHRLLHPPPLGSRALRSPAASAHGKLRLEQGYTRAMMVEESRMLQVAAFQTLQRNVEDTEPGVLPLYVMTSADEVDSQLAQAMTGFAS